MIKLEISDFWKALLISVLDFCKLYQTTLSTQTNLLKFELIFQ